MPHLSVRLLCTAWLLHLAACNNPIGDLDDNPSSQPSSDDEPDDDGEGSASPEPEPDPDCTATYPTSPPAGPDCLNELLSCGDEVKGTTTGGSTRYGASFYTGAHCFVPSGDMDGPERVFALELPEASLANIHLDSPCGTELSLAIVRWEEEERCPTSDHIISQCEAISETPGGSYEGLYSDRASRYLLIVDAPANTEAPFGIRIECQ